MPGCPSPPPRTSARPNASRRSRVRCRPGQLGVWRTARPGLHAARLVACSERSRAPERDGKTTAHLPAGRVGPERGGFGIIRFARVGSAWISPSLTPRIMGPDDREDFGVLPSPTRQSLRDQASRVARRGRNRLHRAAWLRLVRASVAEVSGRVCPAVGGPVAVLRKSNASSQLLALDIRNAYHRITGELTRTMLGMTDLTDAPTSTGLAARHPEGVSMHEQAELA
jgi:hypothetical protein